MGHYYCDNLTYTQNVFIRKSSKELYLSYTLHKIFLLSWANIFKLVRLDVMSFTLWSVVIEPIDSVRDLGDILNSELSLQKHIGYVSSIRFFHIRRLRKLRPVLSQ